LSGTGCKIGAARAAYAHAGILTGLRN